MHRIIAPAARFSKQSSLHLRSQYLSLSASAFRPGPSLQASVQQAFVDKTASLIYQRSFTASTPHQKGMDATSKRKLGDTDTSNRPLKQARSSIPSPKSAILNGSKASLADTPNDHLSPGESDEEVVAAPIAPAETAEWQATIEKVVKNVVSIHFCQTASFDTESALTSEATGFVVDAERGYILTNRHVVGAGPFWGYCIFDNHEECDVYPIYRDPVHDFGILRFDPKAIKYMPLSQLELRPDLARVGEEIRVVGNDAGEKLSILSGVISRLDRNAPDYGEGFNDFNVAYIQAAASASGGSSGSPVVNIDGWVVALQAGGRADSAATDYFLPLDRPLRALQCIQQGKPVTRGDIQVQFVIKAFDECRRLGLTADWEASVRKQFPKETGMLVAEVVLPDGPAHGKLQEGDVLLKINDELLTQFTRFDAILDDSVGRPAKLLVQRGGQNIEVEVDVGDLHAITPDRYVSVAGASFHDLSYQQARVFAVSLKDAGAYCCEASGSFRFDGTEYGWLIQSLDNKPTPNLDAFISVLKQVPDRSRVVVTYKHIRDMHTLNTGIVYLDRHWNKSLRLAVRNDETGLWDFTDLADPIAPTAPARRKANFITMDGTRYPAVSQIVRSFVTVGVQLPLRIDGFPRVRKTGHGLVIDAEHGLVIVSRSVVPYDLCDISITIADSIIVDGKVVFLHPVQNYAIVQYDPSLVGAPVQSAKLAERTIKQGEETIFFGYNQNHRPVVARTTVTDVTTVAIPSSPSTPRYRAVNLDAITVDTSLSSQCSSGVLLDEDGTVQALWLSYLGERSNRGSKDVDIEYFLGFGTPALLPVIEQIKAGQRPDLRTLNIETQTLQMAQARIMGVSEEWIERVQEHDPERHQLFMVRKVDAGNTGGLLEGDIILTLDDRLVTRVGDFDVMYNNEKLKAVIVRKQQQLDLEVLTVPTSELETDRIVVFAGAVLHKPHQAVRQQTSKVHSGVYISGRSRGSPAAAYGLASTNFIMEVNAVPTPDLSSFIEETNKIPDNTYFRLRLMTFDNVPWVVTMKKNEHYFPTVEFVKDSTQREGWRRVKYEHGKTEKGEGDVPQVIENGAAADGEAVPERSLYQ